jgi:hypothetical protein
MGDSPWLLFLLLVCVALGLGLGMGQLHDALATYRAQGSDVMIDRQAREAITLALQHWGQVQCRDDEHWNATFVMLSEAFNHAAYVDVRLYMYTLSDEAAELFRTYDRETFD